MEKVSISPKSEGDLENHTHLYYLLTAKFGVEVYYKSHKTEYLHKKDRELLLAFPVNSQAVSPYIWKYIKSLPNGKGQKVSVVITLNESAFILTPLKKVLEKKGYVIGLSAEISMQNNLFISTDTTINRLDNAYGIKTRLYN